MTILSQQPTGWHEDAPAVRAFVAQRRHAGMPCEIAYARPDLLGFWKSRVLSGCNAILLYEAERYLLGEYLPADYQRRGTCFPAGSMVWMADGSEKPIQDVRVGDCVISHTGLPRKVVDIGSRAYSGDMVSVSLKGWPHSVSMTDEHPVAHYPVRPRMKKLRSDATNRKRRKLAYLPMTWTAAGELGVGDYVLTPEPKTDHQEKTIDVMDYIPDERLVRVSKHPIEIGDGSVRCKQSATITPRHIKCDEEFSRVLGLYAAEGSTEILTTKSGNRIPRRVVWTFCGDEQEFANGVSGAIEKKFGVQCKIRSELPEKNVIRVVCNSKAVASVIHGICPGNALTKRVPRIIFSSPKSHRIEFLRAWADGDGHLKIRPASSEGGQSSTLSVNGVTSSAALAADLCRLSATCGIHASWSPRIRAAHQNVRAENVNFYGGEAAKLYPSAATCKKGGGTPKQFLETEHGWARKVSSIGRIPVHGVTVYNLEVEEEHSYIVSGLAVHNCVGRGSYRAIQTTYWHALWERRTSGRAERIAYEPIYAGGRVNIGRGVIRGDGLVGAWAAQYADEIGVVARGIYGGIDLTRDREDLATQWGEPGAGVPNEIIQASATHKCDIYQVQSAEQLADVTAAGFASAICSTHRQADQRDENGECAYAGPTAHCEAIVGVYMRPSWDGRPDTIYQHTGFVDQQSWGNTPSGTDSLRVYGASAKLRQGAYGTRMQAIEKRIATGETWAFRLRDGFRSGSLTEAVK